MKILIIVSLLLSGMLIANESKKKDESNCSNSIKTIEFVSGKLISNLPYGKNFKITGDTSYYDYNEGFKNADTVELQIIEDEKVIFSDIWHQQDIKIKDFYFLVNKKLKYKSKYKVKVTYYNLILEKNEKDMAGHFFTNISLNNRCIYYNIEDDKNYYFINEIDFQEDRSIGKTIEKSKNTKLSCAYPTLFKNYKDIK